MSSSQPLSMTGNSGESDVHQREASDQPQTVEIDGEERPSEAVVRGVAAATGRSVLDITPLFESVDPDALDALFERLPDGTPRSPGRVDFSLDGCMVSVEGSKVRVNRPVTDPGFSP